MTVMSTDHRSREHAFRTEARLRVSGCVHLPKAGETRLGRGCSVSINAYSIVCSRPGINSTPGARFFGLVGERHGRRR
jgi:hypothetical protein